MKFPEWHDDTKPRWIVRRWRGVPVYSNPAAIPVRIGDVVEANYRTPYQAGGERHS